MESILYQNYSDSFNPSTQISYSLVQDANVSLNIYDILGKEVVTLVNKEQPAGNYEVEFSAKGRSASGGDSWNLLIAIYIYILTSGKFNSAKKVILLK